MTKINLEKIWSQVPPDYYEEGIRHNLLQKLWHNEKWRNLRGFIKKDAKKILDVGCGSGHITYKMHKFFPKASVVGLDVYKKSIDFGRGKYRGVEFIVADAHRLPFKEANFDVVISTESLEHLVSPEKVLLQIRRVLVPGGELIVEMDSGSLLFRTVWYLWTRLGPGRVWMGSHLTKFDSKKLVNMIASSGFIIKEEKVTHMGMGIVVRAEKK